MPQEATGYARTNIDIRQEMLDELAAIAKDLGISRAQLIREILAAALAKKGDPPWRT